MIAPLNELDKLKPDDLWDRPQRTIAAGCTQCPLRRTHCGGLHVDKPIWNCMTLCCQKPETCTFVCPAKPEEYLLRMYEVGGFQLKPIPNNVGVPCGPLPDFVPIIYHRLKRRQNLSYPAVAFPLKDLFHHATGQRLYASKADLLERIRVAQDSRLVLTGVAEDRYIERYWDVGRSNGIAQYISELAPDVVTVPNFSFYLNRPRHEDLHNRKRIVIAFEELLLAGVSTALHINARTLHDFRVWVEFIRNTPAVRTLAFEFGTGATQARQPFYARMLLELNRQVERPLTLIVRGGLSVLGQLRAEYEKVVFLDSTAFSRTRSRRRAECQGQPKIKWARNPTMPGECLNGLLTHNVEACAKYVALRGSTTVGPTQAQRRTA